MTIHESTVGTGRSIGVYIGISFTCGGLHEGLVVSVVEYSHPGCQEFLFGCNWEGLVAPCRWSCISPELNPVS